MRKRNSVIAAIVCVLVVIGLFGYITWSRGHNTADETELTDCLLYTSDAADD